MHSWLLALRGWSVLIETLWNVRLPPAIESYRQRCINRNIVECKERKAINESEVLVVLIETLWNVK